MLTRIKLFVKNESAFKRSFFKSYIQSWFQLGSYLLVYLYNLLFSFILFQLFYWCIILLKEIIEWGGCYQINVFFIMRISHVLYPAYPGCKHIIAAFRTFIPIPDGMSFDYMFSYFPILLFYSLARNMFSIFANLLVIYAFKCFW